MTQQHPITPPDNLIDQWTEDWCNLPSGEQPHFRHWFATQAARWGADQELEECCKAIDAAAVIPLDSVEWLRTVRRPKPRITKGLALQELSLSYGRGFLREEGFEIIRLALEALPD